MVFCSECGKENSEAANFCEACGNTLNLTAESQGNNTQNTNHENNTGSVFAVLGWVFTGISLLFFPILFGAGGAIFGYLHRKVNITHGTIIIIASIACGLFGTLLGAAAAGY